MNRAVCLVKDAGQARRAAAVAACALAMGLAACSSPMPPWQPPRMTIQPAPAPAPAPVPVPVTTLPPAPATQPMPAQQPAYGPPSAVGTEPPRATPGMANPASTYCLQRGGQLEFSTRANGSDVGTCVSPGGDECEEWAFLRGSCTW
jgi:putative hemolysin